MVARLAITTLALLALPAAASASSITYGCDSAVCRMSPTGHHSRKVTDFRNKTTAVLRVSISRDGGRMAFGDGYDTYVTDRRGGHSRHLEPRPARKLYLGAQVSPDGRRLLWTEERMFINTLYLCQSAIGGGDRHCTQNHDQLMPLAWGPGGRPMAVRDLERTVVCAVVKGRCGRVIARTKHSFFGAPQLSPDGRHLVVSNYVPVPGGTRPALEIYDVRTKRKVRSLTSAHRDTLPAWSPDGRRIVFSRDDEGFDHIEGDICVVSARGGPVRRIARGYAPGWSR